MKDVRHKQGDQVRCVDIAQRGGLTLGEVYTVECIYGDFGGKQFVYIKGISDLTPFRANRFEALTAPGGE